jgi:hypothetical protein
VTLDDEARLGAGFRKSKPKVISPLASASPHSEMFGVRYAS